MFIVAMPSSLHAGVQLCLQHAVLHFLGTLHVARSPRLHPPNRCAMLDASLDAAPGSKVATDGTLSCEWDRGRWQQQTCEVQGYELQVTSLFKPAVDAG